MRCCRVDVGTLATKNPEANAAISEILDKVDEVAQVAAEPVELVDNNDVTLANRLQTRFEVRDVPLLLQTRDPRTPCPEQLNSAYGSSATRFPDSDEGPEFWSTE